MIGLAKQFQTFRSVKGLGTEFLWMAMEFLPHTSTKNGQGRLDAFGSPKVKIDYLVLDAKLLLININDVKNFLFLEIL